MAKVQYLWPKCNIYLCPINSLTYLIFNLFLYIIRMSSEPKDSPAHKQMGLIEKLALPYYTSVLLFIIVIYILHTTNQPSLAFAFILITPYLGKFGPKDQSAVYFSKQKNRSVLQALPLAANVLTTWFFVGYIWLNYNVPTYSTQQNISLFLLMVFMMTPSIDAAHELIHRHETILRALGFTNMALFQFSVYPTQHLYLHHKFVGTKTDPITSPKNQNYYSYALNVYISTHKFVFNYSKAIFAGCLAINWTYLAILTLHAYKEFDNLHQALVKTSFFLGVGLGGFCFLQLVEYIEHYGLIVRDDIDKTQINQKSSWNSEHNILHNWMIFRFQRHSDHHMNAYKIFTTLELTPTMPKFPFSFYEGIFISLFPSLWYYVMNPFVDEQIEGKKVKQSHRNNVKIIKQVTALAVILPTVFRALWLTTA